jgi:hypothetical protein
LQAISKNAFWNIILLCHSLEGRGRGGWFYSLPCGLNLSCAGHCQTARGSLFIHTRKNNSFLLFRYFHNPYSINVVRQFFDPFWALQKIIKIQYVELNRRFFEDILDELTDHGY